MPQCVGLSCRFSGRAGRVQALENSPKAGGCLLARAGVGNQVQLVRILTTLLSELKRFRRILQKHFVNIPRA
jgi:hypothetical protein